MHIGFRRSGGRGEYEVVGSHSGYAAISLEGWTFNLSWPDGIVRETGLGLEPAASGKPRLRSLRNTPFQIGRMVAAMLIMPDPRRSFPGVRHHPEVLCKKEYVLTRVGFGPDTEFNNIVDVVTIEPVFVEAENQASLATIGVHSRWNRIRRVYEAREGLPSPVLRILETHIQSMESGDPITEDLCRIVQKLGVALGEAFVWFDPASDALAGMENILGISVGEGPELPAPPEIGESEPDVAARSAFQWRLAKSRGTNARNFRQSVRSAYKDRCVFCGGRFVATGIPSGLDAAHILAWSHYDLDVVSNGLTLCKLHHWAFDGSLIMPFCESGTYYVRFTTLALSLDEQTRDLLGQDGSLIPSTWLPDALVARPSTRYLNRLYADLSIEFSS